MLEMSYANYEPGIVHKYGVELVGWPLPALTLHCYGRKQLQAVVDGLVEGSIRWVRLAEEERVARVQAWTARGGMGPLKDAAGRLKRRAVGGGADEGEDGDGDGSGLALVNGEEVRLAMRQMMMEGTLTSASGST